MSVKEWYKDQRKIKVFTLASGVRMPFEDRLAYSVLAFSRRGLSQRKLAVKTGLERSKTVPKVLDRLTRLSLVECQDQRFQAKEPPLGLFSTDLARKVEHWRDRLNYFLMAMPSEKCPLTIRQVALFFVLHSRNSVHSPSLLAKWLGFSRRGVIYMIERLRGFGLLDPLSRPVRPDAEKLAWWQERLKARRGKLHAGTMTFTFKDFPRRFDSVIRTFREQREDWLVVEDWPGYFHQIGTMCEQAGYSITAVDRLIWETFRQLHLVPSARFVRQLPKLIEEAEKRTARNRANKTYHYATSFGLLKLKVRDFVRATLKAAG